MTAPTQLALPSAPHHNQQLFSDHYLNIVLPDRAEWRQLITDAQSAMTRIAAIADQYTPSDNEAQTERDLIQPILTALGHAFEVQPALRTPDGAKRPDYVCFNDHAALDAPARVIGGPTFAQEAGDVKKPSFDLAVEPLVESHRPEAVEQLLHHLAQLAGLDLKNLRTGRTLDGRLWASAIADHADLTFSRWYIQCQRVELVTLDTVATVLGLALASRPNVLLFAVTGELSDDALTFVADINRRSALKFVCLDIDDLLDIGTSRERLLTMLEQRSSPDFWGL